MRATAALLLTLIAWAVFLPVIMSDKIPQAECTTNEHDRAEAARLKARLAESTPNTNAFQRIDAVSLANGRHKYVLISAREPYNDNETYFVTSRRGAAYHRNAAEPLVHTLEESGYQNIEVRGGGRIFLDENQKKISIFGFSYGFGQADHETSKRVIAADGRFKDYDITISNDGY